MDILDILIAKNKSFSSESAQLVQQAAEIAEQLNNSQDALDAAALAVRDVEFSDIDSTNHKGKKAKITTKDANTETVIVKNYTSTGTNEDGSMTQKAITEALNTITESAGGSSYLGKENEGKIVIIGADGNVIAGNVDEQAIIDTLMRSGAYDATDAVGLEIDYQNRAFTRTQEAVGLSRGADFNKYPMYGGRRRCIVDTNGRIIAWYGENNYIEDGSVGQVMIYQPKFYYNRTISSYESSTRGRIINKEILTISATKQPGFKLHPLFKDENGNEIDYVLLPAYESTFYDVSEDEIVLDDSANIDSTTDYLLSIAGAKPLSGANKNFTVEIAERMAKNIGNGWHITNMAAESANQMLEIVEFGQMNGQIALEAGIVNISNTASINGASITGSTSSLGNTTGNATSTVSEVNGTYNTISSAGGRAISYRGYENPWGNLYRFIGGVNLTGDGSQGSGIAYVANDYNYTPGRNGGNYENIGFQIANTSAWVSAMGYGKPEYDWIYLPIEASGASSLLPIGDFIWVEGNLNGIYNISIGGTQRQGDNCGPFYYACDQLPSSSTASQGARIMHIPAKGSNIYNANIQSWTQQMGA